MESNFTKSELFTEFLGALNIRDEMMWAATLAMAMWHSGACHSKRQCYAAVAATDVTYSRDWGSDPQHVRPVHESFGHILLHPAIKLEYEAQISP